ncbi:MAG: HisA/HisF-related TIM barrel protein [Janthinobacterium lividum]
MDIIPVLDLKSGEAVHARMGRRDEYRPIQTPLCHGSAPGDVVDGLLRLAAFPRFYVADLDAIERRGDHASVLRALAAARPGVELWVDSGVGDARAARSWLDGNPGALVLGSESLDGVGTMRGLCREPRVVLSLDFRGEVFAGPEGLLDDVAAWPDRVVVMTLARVGATQGPDVARVAAVVARAEGRRVYAAGGVRGATDLGALRDVGAAGALVATALHGGAITREDVAAARGVEDARG